MSKAKVIAIDGPSGSGKSTIAKKLAQELGLTYLDTGAMFRAIACALESLTIDFSVDTLTPEQELQVAQKLEDLDFQYAPTDKILVAINGIDLTTKIREHEISLLTSHISKFPLVRNYLKNVQRKIAANRASILEGRDIGTVIFPNAAIKIFLTADNKARAQRRFDQLVEKDPAYAKTLSVEQIEKDLQVRDEQDSKRALAPLRKAEDALEVDTTSMTIEEVCQLIKEKYQSQKHLFE